MNCRRPMDEDGLLDSLMDRTFEDESESVEAELWRRVDESEHATAIEEARGR